MSLPPMPSPSPQPVASLPEGGGSRRPHARRLTEGVSSPAQGAVPGSRLMPHPTGKEQTLPSPPQTVATPPLSGEAFVPPAPTVGPTNVSAVPKTAVLEIGRTSNARPYAWSRLPVLFLGKTQKGMANSRRLRIRHPSIRVFDLCRAAFAVAGPRKGAGLNFRVCRVVSRFSTSAAHRRACPGRGNSATSQAAGSDSPADRPGRPSGSAPLGLHNF